MITQNVTLSNAKECKIKNGTKFYAKLPFRNRARVVEVKSNLLGLL